jgi:predicted metal-dependent HD superfamily phosphohydrolase
MFDCRHRPLQLPDVLVAKLAAAYGEPQRAYHNATHIAEVLGWFDRITEDIGWREPAEVYVAMVFHDAIYVPGATDNEARSAQWAREAQLPVDGERVTALIELTAWHGTLSSAEHDAALFLDSDMAILGAPPEQFAAYNAAIAREYSQLPREAFEAGRRGFLSKLAARRRIYISEYFHALLDAQARANLAAALA